MTLPDYLSDIATFLQTNGIGTFGTDLFLYGFPKDVLNCIVIIPAPGYATTTTITGDLFLYHPELDIRVRNSSAQLAESKSRAIFDLLNLITNSTIGSTRFKRIEAVSPPYLIMRSEVDDVIYGVNFNLSIE